MSTASPQLGKKHPPMSAATASVEPFMTGMLDAEKNEFHSRPAYIFQMTDGSLLVSDELHGATYRISYMAAGAADK
jgi:glucose/arabinose dehydrogenase